MLDRERALEKARETLGSVVSHARREPGWPFRHGFRTANLSLWLRERLFPGEAWMDDILYAAALFHDCAKDDEADHGEAGARRAEEYLRGIVAERDMGAVTRAIALHNKRGLLCTDVDRLLQDADIADHFGAIEVWLNVSYSVLGGEGPERSLEFYRKEWSGMIEELRGMFNFALARAVFEERIAYNEEFIRRLEVESLGGVMYPERILHAEER